MTFLVVITDLATRFDEIRAIREDVFVREQGIARDLDCDDRDKECVHALVMDGDRPVATGRLDLGREGKIGRVAVLKTDRRRGLGSLVMNALEVHAREQGLSRIWFHAQVAAIPFYEAIGYLPTGPIFEEAGIAHQFMEKTFSTVSPNQCDGGA